MNGRNAFELLFVAALAVACRTPQPLGEAEYSNEDRQAVELVLDDFHLAASEADAERYFAHMSEDMIFLGTDATERWTREQFRSYAEARFARGQGWTYRPMERHVFFGPDHATAWFDERLWNEKYGETRGTGALRKIGGTWKVAHYNLTFTVPNAIAPELVELVRKRAEVESPSEPR